MSQSLCDEWSLVASMHFTTLNLGKVKSLWISCEREFLKNWGKEFLKVGGRGGKWFHFGSSISLFGKFAGTCFDIHSIISSLKMAFPAFFVVGCNVLSGQICTRYCQLHVFKIKINPHSYWIILYQIENQSIKEFAFDQPRKYQM